jgi:glycosyltransferase involved in cell wall biosynthesis
MKIGNIIVDDSSIDETLNMIKKYELKKQNLKFTLDQPQKIGANSCRNYGVEQMWVSIFLNSDDILKK